MPSPLPSSFASAAAGNIPDSGRRGDGSGEWSRPRMNGATQTFRRPSVATNPSHNRESGQSTSAATTPTVGTYVPPHLNSNSQSSGLRNGTPGESRYSKDQLLNLYKSQRETGNLGKNVSDYFVADWNPHQETPSANGAWGKRDDHKDTPSGPEICWDHGGHVEPLGLVDLTDDEKELFSTTVNSPLKPPPSSASKDNAGVVGGRKTSVSNPQSHINTFNTSSPSAGRPGTRRRETGDSIGNPISPTAGSRFFRDEPNTSTPPPALLRRKTDFRDSVSNSKLEEKEKENSARDGATDLASPFGSLKRSTTNPLSAGLPTSPWPSSASQNASFSPMGAFGAFSLGSAGGQERRPGLGGLRGESRFKGLLSKDSSEDIGASVKENTSLSGLERLPENESDERSQSAWGEAPKTRATRSDTNPFGSDEPRSGSAALGGSREVSTPSQGIDQLGFGAFGMTSSVPGFRELMQSHANSPSQASSHLPGQEPTSPTNTNPYQSPHGDKSTDAEDVDTDGSDVQNTHLPGLSSLRDDAGPFASIRRAGSGMGDVSVGDRSQTSSAGPTRSFSGLGGLGGLSGLGGAGGWPPSAGVGTPTRERSAFTGFGDPIFGSMADLQSPSLSTLGGGGFFGSHGALGTSGSIGRASKLGSLFPPAMQEQMQGDLSRQDSAGLEGLNRQTGEATTRSVIGGSPGKASSQTRNEDQSLRGNYSGLDGLDIGSRLIRGEDPLSAEKQSQINTPVTTASQAPAGSTPGMASSHDGSQSGQNIGQPGSASGLGSVPTAQQRTMVMPDRMRWIYRDPQGNIQGPWSGLEMHDWFKAGFFTAELQVKKLEDTEFEPLAQLVRRIGNSREPFLVPQIGIPHGPDPTPSPWGTGPATQPGAAQPPFANSFPSFGTTLTAEQQNALERRKQEEQYLMARQKEHLAQQQQLMKQMHLQPGPHTIHPQLQHHSSAHSLHSQPSYGSITSPGGYQPSPLQGPIQPPQAVPGFFDAAIRQNPVPSMGPQLLGSDPMNSRDDLPALLERLNVGRPGPFQFNNAPSAFGPRQPDDFLHSQQVASMLQDRARLQQEQEQFDRQQAENIFDQQARDERLRQFHAMRSQEDELGMRIGDGLPTHPPSVPAQEASTDQQKNAPEESFSAAAAEEQSVQAPSEPLSLSQQVQKAASAQRQQQQQQQEQQQHQQQHQQQKQSHGDSAWASKPDNGMPQPFPPPPSASPLPAPAAQRNRQNVAESLAATSRSQNQTPIETPTTSIAPWAKEPIEPPKGPSLKEIQEAEERSAAQREEQAAAARRAQMLAEQERLSQQSQADTPGLPSTANWASAGSPATPGSTGSVWNKNAASKTQAAPANAPVKKTLAQIQKEEEALSSTGKRYADLASKPASATPPPSTGAWTTVGAGGKAKAPPAAPLGPRSASVSTTPASNPNRATEELAKWANLSLSKGLNSSINVDDFVQQLLLLPAEAEIISDSIYANSQTLDGRRFAEEFIRRRKLADKGIVDPVSTSAFADKGSSGGWSEVAKKGSSNAHREEDNGNAAFKVVAAKKKGKR
ncbi:hypothetical protein DTO271G3_784 [Paecilomyces variotii]|nr:hypothetical protein DTO271G3_784 [Paecilomyces variotii]